MSSPIEPHADIRNVAASWRQLFVACTEQQFTEEQAMQLVVAFIHGPGGGRR